MTQAIIMTIRPKHLVKILNGEKTIEPRKTIPKCELPIDVYLYCTKEKPYLYENWDGRCYKLTRTKTWQERANEEDYTSVEMFHLEDFGGEVNGKVVAKFTLNKVGKVSLELIDSSGYDEDKEKEYVSEHLTSDELTSKSCLDEYNIDNYLLSRSGFAWHIDNLVVFDKPKELKEFYKQLNYGKEIITPNIATDQETLNTFRLTKAPQSWQYVWVKE